MTPNDCHELEACGNCRFSVRVDREGGINDTLVCVFGDPPSDWQEEDGMVKAVVPDQWAWPRGVFEFWTCGKWEWVKE